jgi:hypothetical protein
MSSTTAVTTSTATTQATTATTVVQVAKNAARTSITSLKKNQTSATVPEITTNSISDDKRRVSVTSKHSIESVSTQTESERANSAADAVSVAVNNLQAIASAIREQNTLQPSVIRRSVSDNKKELLLSSDSIISRQEFDTEIAAIEEDTDYYDYVIKPRHVRNRNCLKSCSAMELKATAKSVRIDEDQQREYARRFNDDFNDREIFEEEVELNDEKAVDSSELLTSYTNEHINKSLHESLDGNLSDNTIKTVVDKCFNQIAKNKKIKSPCIYVKHSHNKLSSDQASNSATSESKSQIKLININPAVDDNNNEVNRSPTKNATSQKLPSASSVSSMCSSETMSSIDNPNLKQTVVEKAADILNAPTNTLLLSSGNDANELYSLKITFV